MAAEPQPIFRRKLYQEVADRLLERLRSGDFADEGRLPSEREIMQTYGVGRPAVREALLTIERMGLISIVHGERARIAHPTFHTLMDQIGSTVVHVLSASPQHRGYLREARLFFETGMVRMAAARASADDVKRLRAIVKDQVQGKADPQLFSELDMAFHREIARISGNPIFVAVSQAMSEWLQEFRQDLIHVPGVEDLTIAEHKSVLSGIDAHDCEGAVKAMADHLNRVNKLYPRFDAPDERES